MPAYASSSTPLQTLFSPTMDSGDRFGTSVEAFGNDILIGAPNDDSAGPEAGAVYLFDGETGALIRAFLPPPGGGGGFGASVDAFGSLVLIGARFDNTGGTFAGAAYIFDGLTGELLKTFLNPTPASGDQFGASVAGVRDSVIIGAPFDDTAGSNAGAVYVFDIFGHLIRTILNPDPGDNALDFRGDLFGRSVRTFRARGLLVGSPFNDLGATDAGTAYLFDLEIGLLERFLNPTPETLDGFGWSVATVGFNFLFGAPGDDTRGTNTGAVYVYEAGNLKHALFDPTPVSVPEFGDNFGVAVGSFASHILIGAVFDDTGGFDTGSAYLFDSTTGELIKTFPNPTPALEDLFGEALATVGDNILVAAPQDDTMGEDAGAVYLFRGLIRVSIDIKPGGDPNSINVKSQGVVPVGILTTPDFDATTVDPSTVRFGRFGIEASPAVVPPSLEDVDGDGDLDGVFQFSIQDTGIQAGDTQATLTGRTFEGTLITGTDSVRAFFPGDVNGDLVVNVLDLVLAGSAFGSTPDSQRWNLYADFNEDGIINILDLVVVGSYFGQHA